MREHRKTLDKNIYVLEWDLERNNHNKNIDTTQGKNPYHPASKEWKDYEALVEECKENYTAFNNMLRYSRGIVNKNFDHSRDESIKWDLDAEYGFKHSESLTPQLYEERAKEMKNTRYYQETKQKLGGVGL